MSDKKFINNLFYRGEVYMNSVNFFRDLEKENEERGDSYECHSYLEKVEEVIFRNDNGETYSIIPNNHDVLYDGDYSNGNLLCFYGIDTDLVSDDLQINIPKKLYDDFEFNEENTACFLIYKPYGLIKRIRLKLEELGYDMKFSPVSYFVFDRNMYIGPFRKREKYSYQHEYRIFAQPVKGIRQTAIKFDIGSIEDIAIMVEPFKMCAQITLQDPKSTNILVNF